MRKIAIATGTGYGLPLAETIRSVAAAGFDGCFTGWHKGEQKEIRRMIDESGLIYQSVHAPFNKVHKMWEEGPEGEAVTDELIDCLHDCAEADVPIVVIHPIIGMDRHSPNGIGIERFGRLIGEAEKTDVKLALENVEGIEYLLKLRDAFISSPSVGFCWDTGHEMCYNHSADVPSMFGGKLICTHLNDNLAQTDPDVITWLDDSHLMPFDGKADWNGIASRLKREKYDGILTFELTCKSKPGKNTHDVYASLDQNGFLRLAAEKARRFAGMCDDLD